MNSLFSFARHKSSIINSPVPIILLLLLCCIAGCRGGHPAEKEEADDLQQIKDSGELVVLTLYSSTSYFIYRGQDMGFQYELSEQFAKSLGVKLRIEVARNVHELIEKLQAGKGDLIAYNLPITKEWKDSLLYCGEEVITHQVIVQRNGGRTKPLKDVTELIGKDVYVKPGKYYERLVNLDGKTTVVRKIIESLPAGEVVLLPQDSYYKDSSHVPVEERQNINFDHPDAFEWSLLSRHVAMLREGRSIEQPTYSYLTCTRQPETIHIEPREVIIIEGILALCDKKLRSMMDLKIFVDADPDERLIRVIQRDVVERGRTAEAVMERYTRILKPMHQQFIEPCKRYADLIVPEGGNNQVAIDILTMYIKKHLGS